MDLDTHSDWKDASDTQDFWAYLFYSKVDGGLILSDALLNQVHEKLHAPIARGLVARGLDKCSSLPIWRRIVRSGHYDEADIIAVTVMTAHRGGPLPKNIANDPVAIGYRAGIAEALELPPIMAEGDDVLESIELADQAGVEDQTEAAGAIEAAAPVRQSKAAGSKNEMDRHVAPVEVNYQDDDDVNAHRNQAGASKDDEPLEDGSLRRGVAVVRKARRSLAIPISQRRLDILDQRLNINPPAEVPTNPIAVPRNIAAAQTDEIEHVPRPANDQSAPSTAVSDQRTDSSILSTAMEKITELDKKFANLVKTNQDSEKKASSLKKKNKRLEKMHSSHKKRIRQLTESVRGLKHKVRDQQEELMDCKDDIRRFKRHVRRSISKWKPKKTVSMGDSSA
ncbi:hypothetical protein ACHAQH_006133 [Verticillium albo-atrum]